MRISEYLGVTMFVLLLTACGGGGSNSNNPVTPPVDPIAPTTLSLNGVLSDTIPQQTSKNYVFTSDASNTLYYIYVNTTLTQFNGITGSGCSHSFTDNRSSGAYEEVCVLDGATANTDYTINISNPNGADGTADILVIADNSLTRVADGKVSNETLSAHGANHYTFTAASSGTYTLTIDGQGASLLADSSILKGKLCYTSISSDDRCLFNDTRTSMDNISLTAGDVIHLVVSGDPATTFSMSFGDGTTVGTLPKLIYQAEQDTAGLYELYAVAQDNSVSKVSSGANTGAYKVSPDGNYIAYLSDQDTTGVFELYIAPVNGGASIKANSTLKGGKVWNDFLWSPDSQYVAYRAEQDAVGVIELYTTSRDGTKRNKVNVPLITGDTTYNGFAWSPTANKLLYECQCTTNGKEELRVAAADGSGDILVYQGTFTLYVDSFKWSPTGNHVSINLIQLNNTSYKLMIVNADGTSQVIAHPNISLTSSTGTERYTGIWSPDGSRIAYVAEQDAIGVMELFAINTDGTGLIKLSGNMVALGNIWTSTGTSKNYAWSPDGTHIAYIADQTTDNVRELYATKADGTANTRLNSNLVTNGYVVSFNWSPDSSLLAYNAIQDTAGVTELYTVATDATSNNKVHTPISTGSIGFIAWLPDSQKLLYGSSQSIFITTPDATGETLLSASTRYDSLLSNDASMVAYTALNSGVGELRVINIDGSNDQVVSGAVASPTLKGTIQREFVWIQ